LTTTTSLAHGLRALAAAALAASFAAATPALAQAPASSYPTKTVRVIVPFAAGGGSDAVARILSQKLSEKLGQQFVVENRTGAGGSIGADAVAKAAPDGYTLLLGSSSEVALYPSLQPKSPYDPTKDFTAIALVAVSPLVFVANDTLPAKSIRELVQAAKANPGKITYGSAGNGSTTHLAVELFASMAGIQLLHVPYKGSAPVITDLLNGNLSFALSTMPPALPHAKSGKLKMLAVTTARRAPALPDVPTVQEAGVAGYTAVLWTALLGPAGLPPEIVDRLARESAAALALPDVKEALAKQGAEPSPSSPAELAALIRTDLATWQRLVRDAGIKPE
jgi:tripartite-type tricarboxylate transporter receptor subunit TctC